MSRNRSFERRAREEVECIKAQEAAEEERKQARMWELAEQARERREAEAAEQRWRMEERHAKLRRSEDKKAEGEERLAKIALGARGKSVAGRRLRLRRRGRRCGRRCSSGAPWTPIGGRAKRWLEAASAAFREPT